MTPSDFTHYLNGFKDSLPAGQPPTAAQWETIQKALKTVFTKETPDRFTSGGFVIGGGPAAPHGGTALVSC